MAKEKKYKAETRTSFVNFLSEATNYVAVIVTAIITLSLSMFMDLINSTCNLLRTGFATFLAKKLQKNLKFKYNYGTDKLETLSMVFCDSLLVVGTFVILGFALYRLIFPEVISKALLTGVVLKAINVTVDTILLFVNLDVYRKKSTKVSKSNFEGSISSWGFDFAIFLSVLLSYLLNGWSGVAYVEPIASIVIAFFVIVRAFARLRTYSKELVNVTLKEEDQLKIDKILSKHCSRYDDFYSVSSRQAGDTVYVDFRISFTDETTYKEIKDTLDLFRKDLNEVFEKVEVTIVIDKA